MEVKSAIEICEGIRDNAMLRKNEYDALSVLIAHVENAGVLLEAAKALAAPTDEETTTAEWNASWERLSLAIQQMEGEATTEGK